MAGFQGSAQQILSKEQRKILEAFQKSDKPAGAKDIAEATGLDKKVISSTISTLKKTNLLDSPVRCKYGITGDGVNALQN
ncbi:MAG: ArsR family transcriptional regulator [Desulfopila sp.]